MKENDITEYHPAEFQNAKRKFFYVKYSKQLEENPINIIVQKYFYEKLAEAKYIIMPDGTFEEVTNKPILNASFWKGDWNKEKD